MNKMRQNLITLLMMLACLSTAYASVNASLDRSEMQENETIILQVETDQDNAEIENLGVLAKDFKITNSQQSSSTTVVNGQFTHTTKWQFELFPNKTGNLTIPSFKVGNENSQALTLKVNKEDASKANLPTDDVFVEMHLENAKDNKVYPQQNFYITVKLWVAVDLVDAQLSDLSAEGLTVSKINENETRAVKNNKTYRIFTRSYVAFAEKSGEITIPATQFQGATYSAYSTGNGRRFLRAKSPELTINVQAFSNANQTTLISSDVQLKETWSPPPYKVGEPIYRTIELKVKDILKNQAIDIKLPELKNAKVYEDSSDEPTSSFDGKNIVTTKKHRFVILPTQAGELHIDEFKLPWFNTQTNQAAHATLTPSILMIEGDAKAAASTKNNTNSPAAVNDENNSNKPNNVNENKTPEPNNKEAVSNATTSFWQIIALLSALLNIVLLSAVIYLWRKSGGKKQAQELSASAKMNEFKLTLKSAQSALTQAKSAGQMQKILLDYWNSHFEASPAHNLSDIMRSLSDEKALKVLVDLQNNLYQQSGNQTALQHIDWAQVLAALKPQSTQFTNNVRLPNLYD